MGVLESLPQRLSNQQRDWTPRSDLEGLLSSSRASDWRKVASWFLGPEPEGFEFTVREMFSIYVLYQIVALTHVEYSPSTSPTASHRDDVVIARGEDF